MAGSGVIAGSGCITGGVMSVAGPGAGPGAGVSFFFWEQARRSIEESRMTRVFFMVDSPLIPVEVKIFRSDEKVNPAPA
jgi:hypothetical protein